MMRHDFSPDCVCIQFGSGTNKLPPPWTNTDRDSNSPGLRVDITKLPLPYHSGSVDFILIEHCLEHVTGPQAYRFLEEAYRILKMGGKIRICVPELKRLDHVLKKDIILNHGHLIVLNFDILWELLNTAGFTFINETGRAEIDGHYRVIGLERDTLETLRVEAMR